LGERYGMARRVREGGYVSYILMLKIESKILLGKIIYHEVDIWMWLLCGCGNVL